MIAVISIAILKFNIRWGVIENEKHICISIDFDWIRIQQIWVAELERPQTII
jgi:hypothetical protein